jgi:fatty-acid desaturase
MNSELPTKITGIYRHPESKTPRRWQNEHRRLFACDSAYHLRVCACLAVWFFTCFAPLVYFALFPDKFLALSRSIPLLLVYEFLLAGGMLLFLRYSRHRALRRHSEV